MTLIATAQDGSTDTYQAPKNLTLLRGLGSPAANLTATMPVAGFPREFRSVRLLEDNIPLFEGAVDEQRLRISADGTLLTLEARDRGAGPLDNEALPRSLWGANLITMFTRYIAPYGFTLHNRMPSRTLPIFTVYKGMSDWEAFSNFVSALHGIRPHVQGDRVIIGRPESSRRHVFSNTVAEGLRYAELTQIRTPYAVLSKIYLRDAEGYYSSSMEHPAAVAQGVQRCRYAIPATEFSENPGLDAKLRLHRSQYAAMAVQVRCPGIHRIFPGDSATVTEPGLFHALMVDEVVHTVSAEGLWTQCTLRNPQYYV